MVQKLLDGALRTLPDIIVYAAIAVVLVFAALRCFVPLGRNARALRRAARELISESKLQPARPAWNEVDFLGASLRGAWARFLQNAEFMHAHGEPCDVEDYINADTAVYGASNEPLAELTPGVLVSLGILGTFWGLVVALRGVNLNDPSLIAQTIQSMIGGMFVAYFTSICGIIGSLLFNYTYRYLIARGERALDRFLTVFQEYAMPKPADAGNKMLAMQQEQNEHLRSFVEEVSMRTATQIEQAILRALLPVQRSMDNFIVAATREQVDGMDRVAARFAERMNLLLDGQFVKLGETMAQLSTHHQHTQADMQATTAAISTVTGEVLRMQEYAQGAIGRLDESARRADEAGRSAEEIAARSAELLESMHATAMQQAKYLVKLQEYQAELQNSVQQYAAWSDKQLEARAQESKATGEDLSQISRDMQDSAALLQTSYESFVENLQAGLARALGMFDDNMTGIAKDLNAAMNGIHAAVRDVPALMSDSARRYSDQVNQFVDALRQLQRSMQSVSTALAEQAARREVG